MLFSEDVTIKDKDGRSFIVEIDTPSVARLSVVWAVDKKPMAPFRPKIWGGSWKVKDQGFITLSKGDVWFQKHWADNPEGRQHFDIILCKEGERSYDDGADGVTLYSFLGMDTFNSGGGEGELHQKWALSCKPGELSWNIPTRYR